MIKRFIGFAGWPVALGLLIAVAVILLQPDWFSSSKKDIVLQPPLEPTFDQESLSPTSDEYGGAASYANAVRRAAPAVVNIYTSKPRPRHPLLDDPVFRQYFNIAEPPEQQRILSSLGSGVIVSEDGYILTNQHVISGADEFLVFLNDGRSAEATSIGANTDSDLAVLKIDLDNLTAINIGIPEQAQVGDVVLAIGNPFGVGQSVSQGIISATGRLGKTQRGLQSFLQTDAAINPGNSGGALVDVYGNLLGINTAIFGGQAGESIGIGFAIPANTAVDVLKEIIAFSQTVHGYLGVMASPLTPRLARSLNLSFTNGLVITQIDADSPAQRAGLKPGDVITRVNDQTFEVDGSSIAEEIGHAKPGDSVIIEVWRKGQPSVVTVKVGASDASANAGRENDNKEVEK